MEKAKPQGSFVFSVKTNVISFGKVCSVQRLFIHENGWSDVYWIKTKFDQEIQAMNSLAKNFPVQKTFQNFFL